MGNASEYPKVTSRVSQEMKDWIVEQAEAEHRSESNFVSLALHEYRKLREGHMRPRSLATQEALSRS